VINSDGAPVDTIPIGPSLGAWNGRFGHVYRLDFTGVTTDGTYTISADGATHPGSRSPRRRPSTRRISPTRSTSTRTSGTAPTTSHSAALCPGHLNDGHATVYETPPVDANGNFRGDLTALGETIDAAGGWWDAGDYLKFVETTSYVVALMLAGVKTFPAQMGPGSADANFTSEAEFGLEWLMEMWNHKTETLYYQVGIGAGNTTGTILSDHDIWRLPQDDDTYGGTNPAFKYVRDRPVFEAAPAGSKISPNLAGRLAADFGLCYQVFRTSSPSLADSCLVDGETVFGLAKTSMWPGC